MAYSVAQSVDDLDAYLESHGNDRGVMAQDTETTGLNYVAHEMVGTSISLQRESGIYLPFRHSVGKNVPIEECLERIANKVDRDGLVVAYFGAKFDRHFLDKDGFAVSRFRDVQQAVYLADCERKDRDLKTLAREDVGFDMARFESLFTPEERKAKDFVISRKPPTRCGDYACSDADGTIRLDEHYDWVLSEFDFPLKIDTKLVDVVREMEALGGLEVNQEFVEEQAKILRWRVEALEAVIYRLAGGKFTLGHPATLGAVLFDKLGLPHPFVGTKFAKTKSGQWSTNEEALSRLAQTEPIAGLIIAWRKVSNASGRYIKRLQYLIDNEIPPRFTLNMVTATTFRFSAPGGQPEKGKARWDGKSGMNAQAIGKGTKLDLWGVDLSAKGSAREYVGELDEDELLLDIDGELGHPEEGEVRSVLSVDDWEEVIAGLPYIATTERKGKDGAFQGYACFRDHCGGCPAKCCDYGIDVTRREVPGIQMVPSMRRAFKAPAGYQLVSFDYDRQEVVIAANLSGEPVWIKSLLAGEDIHAATAMEVFGFSKDEWDALPEGDREDRRDIGKRLNFGTLFGATAHTLSRRMNISLSAAEQIWEDYRQGLPILFKWIDATISNARATGYTWTYFGRRRPLKRFYDSDNPKMRSFADRAAVNTPVQGTGADATRISMAKIAAMFRREQIDRAQAFLGLQIHDELMYVIRDDLVVPIARKIRDEMQFRVKSWPVQLEVGGKAGEVWGRQEKLDLGEAA